ncbi:MAG TPA: tetratricopeptide repeat protein [Thermoanaerobaculia bacterium]|nr:tetratricopeptide repeat protein [Thermoanaerobaculia bacterium]
MSDRVSRKAIKHDKFVEEMETAYMVARRNAPIVIGSLIGILVLIALLVGAALYFARQEKVAQQKLAEAIEVIEAPVAGAEAELAEGSYRSEAEKIAKAEPMFREVTSEYGSRDAADVANLYLARIEAGRNEIAPAREKLEEFIDDHPDHILAQSARVSLYEIRLAAGEAADVASELDEQLAGGKLALPADVGLSLLARAYEAAGQPAQAREAYQRIVNEYPDSPYTLEAQRRLARG